MKFFITMGPGEVRDSFFTQKAIDRLKTMGEVCFPPGDAFSCSKEELMNSLKDVDVLFTGWSAPRVDAEVLACADQLKIHAHTGGAVAAFVSKEEYDRGIHVLSGNDLYAKSVAEGCLTYTLTALRRTDEYLDAMKNTGWRPQRDHTLGLIKKKVGIVGFGAIARYYAKLLQWFDVELLIYSGHITDEEIKSLGARKATREEIFSSCDVISLHSALNDENRGMITEDLIQSIPDGALFVNTARAGLMKDGEALIKELKKCRFKAVLDVYDKEPLDMESELRKLSNVMLFPHIAGPTFDMREQVVFSLIDDINKICNGELPHNAIPYEYAIRMTH